MKKIQINLLPKGMTEPFFVTVDKPNEAIIKIQLDKGKMNGILQNIRYQLSQEKMNVNAYLLPTEPINGLKVSPWTVNAYWWNLPKGIGHKSNATSGKYLNMNINMKGLLNKILSINMKSIDDLYELGAVSTSAENLEGFMKEFDLLLQALHTTNSQQEQAFYGWNQKLFEGMDPFKRNEQILHFRLREYFSDPFRQAQIFDRVALQLSFGSDSIKEKLTKAYYAQYSHDRSMRRVQQQFKEIFESDEFFTLVTQEIGAEMTNMINKMFIAV